MAVGVTVENLQWLVRHHKPEIVHFCGHGSGQEGLIFKADGGGERRVQASALAGMFRLFNTVECVLLNACYSEEQATAIAKYTDYVIGMSDTIQYNAAIAFSRGFYTALGDGCSIELSFEFGKNAIQLEVSESLTKRSSAAAVEERKVEVAGVVETTELKEHEKPHIFIRGKEQTTSDLDQIIRSSQSIPDTKRDEVLLKIDASLGNLAEQPKQTLETNNITAPNKPLSQGTRAGIQVDIDKSLEKSIETYLPDQHFKFNDSYRIKSKTTGKVLAISNSSTKQGSDLIQWKWLDGEEQKFQIFRTEGEEEYSLRAKHSRQCVAIPDGSRDAGVSLIQWKCNGDDEQKFSLIPLDGYYAIKAKHSGMVITVNKNEEKICQYPQSSDQFSDDQLFKIEEV